MCALLLAHMILLWRDGASSQISQDVRITTESGGRENDPELAMFGNDVVAVWFRSGIGRNAGWGFSRDGGTSWTDGGFLPYVAPSNGILGQPSICADGEGNFYVAALHNVSQGCFIGVSKGSFQPTGFVWNPQVAATPPITNTLLTGVPYDMPRLTCDRDRGILYLSYARGTSTPTPDVHDVDYTVEFVRSEDHGLTWTNPLVLGSNMSNGSRPAVGPDGEVYVVWVDFGSAQIVGAMSLDFGVSFPNQFTVSPFTLLGNSPPGCQHSDRQNPLYDACGYYLAPGFFAVDVDRTNGPYRGRVYVTFAESNNEPLGPFLDNYYEQEPNDRYYSANPISLGLDVRGQVTGEPIDRTGDSDIFALDLLEGTTISIASELTFVYIVQGDSPPCFPLHVICGRDTLQPIISARTGVQEDWRGPLPPLVYTAPTSGRYYIGLGLRNNVFNYTLRIRSVLGSPSTAAQDHRDVVLTSSSDGGVNWTPHVRVNDSPPRFDNLFPEVAVDAAGSVHLAWYDWSSGPDSCGVFTHTYWTSSADGGASFYPSTRLSNQPGYWQQFPFVSDGHNVGDHLGLAVEGERAVVLWTQMGQPDIDVYSVTIVAEPVAVAFSQLAASLERTGVRLNWAVEDDANVLRFQLYRSEAPDGTFDVLGESISSHDSNRYTYYDDSVVPGNTYWYRLKGLHRDGSSDLAELGSITIPAIDDLLWRSAEPNPFQSSIKLELLSPTAGLGSVRIFNVTGEEVVCLFEGNFSPGMTTLTWNGSDQRGHGVSPGVYFLQAVQGESNVVRKIVKSK